MKTLILNDDVETATVNLALREYARRNFETALANIRAGNSETGRKHTADGELATRIVNRLEN